MVGWRPLTWLTLLISVFYGDLRGGARQREADYNLAEEPRSWWLSMPIGKWTRLYVRQGAGSINGTVVLAL